jgi:hypothetical protein
MALTKVSGNEIDNTSVISTQSIIVSGVSTVGSLSIGSTQVISAGRQLQNIASLDATTTATIFSGAISGITVRDSSNNIVGASGSISQLTFGNGLSVTGTTGAAGIATITSSNNIVGTSLSISGISTLGITSATNLTAQQLNVSGDLTLTTVPFINNVPRVSSNYNITTAYNSMSIGPLTINSGVAVTVSLGAQWTII